MKTPLDSYVIDKVLFKRKELGISQAGLAAILEVSVGFVGQVESKKYETKYSVYQIYLLCKHFDCPPSELFPPIDTDTF
ncbi:MAG: helix-turn-helix transcriptional regulator [Mucinivorans sp.]